MKGLCAIICMNRCSGREKRQEQAAAAAAKKLMAKRYGQN
jgi:hypothetical protein